MTTRWLTSTSLFVMLLFAGRAFADDDIKTYVANIVAAPDKADIVTASSKITILPSGKLLTTGVKLRAKDVLGADVSGVVLVVTKVTGGTYLSISMLSWFDAEIEARVNKKVVDRLRLVGLGATVGPDFDQYAITVAHWSHPISDKDARKLPATTSAPTIKDEIAPGPAHDSDYEYLINSIKLSGDNVVPFLAGSLANSNEMVIFGSAARERYQGKTAAAKVKAWKMKLAPAGGSYRAQAGDYCMVSAFTGTTTTKPVATIPFIGVLCHAPRETGGGSAITVPVFASFAVPH